MSSSEFYKVATRRKSKLKTGVHIMNKHSGSSFDDFLKEEEIEIVDLTHCAHGKPIEGDCDQCTIDALRSEIEDLNMRYCELYAAWNTAVTNSLAREKGLKTLEKKIKKLEAENKLLKRALEHHKLG